MVSSSFDLKSEVKINKRNRAKKKGLINVNTIYEAYPSALILKILLPLLSLQCMFVQINPSNGLNLFKKKHRNLCQKHYMLVSMRMRSYDTGVEGKSSKNEK